MCPLHVVILSPDIAFARCMYTKLFSFLIIFFYSRSEPVMCIMTNLWDQSHHPLARFSLISYFLLKKEKKFRERVTLCLTQHIQIIIPKYDYNHVFLCTWINLTTTNGFSMKMFRCPYRIPILFQYLCTYISIVSTIYRTFFPPKSIGFVSNTFGHLSDFYKINIVAHFA